MNDFIVARSSETIQIEIADVSSFQNTEIPQIIMVSFEGTISRANIEQYRGLFADVNNPNGCAGRGTFFIEDEGTDYVLVKNLATEGHEIGIQSVSGVSPKDSTEWIEALGSKCLNLRAVFMNII